MRALPPLLGADTAARTGALSRQSQNAARKDPLSQALLKFLLPLALLEILPTRPFRVQPFLPSPLFPRDRFHLHPQKEHHVAICRRVGIGPEEMFEQVFVPQFGVGEEVVLGCQYWLDRAAGVQVISSTRGL